MNRKNGTFYTGKPTDHSSPYFVWLCAVLHRSTGKDWYRDLAIAKGGEIIDAFPQMTKTPTALGLSGSIVGTTLFELTKKKEYLDFMEKCARTVVRDHGRWTQDGNHFYMTQNFIGYPRVSCILSSLYRTGSVLWQTVRYRGKFKKELASMAKFYLDRLSQIEIGRDPEFFRPEKRLSAADTTERAFENRLGFRRNSTDFRERFLSADFAKTVFAARNIARVITDGSIDFKPAYDSLLNLGKKHRWTIPFDTVDEGLRFNNTGYGVRQDIGGTAWSLLAFATLDDSDQIDKENPSRCLAQKLLAPQVASTTHNIFLGVPQLAINGLRDVHTSVDTDAVGLHALLATSGRKDILDGIDFI